MDRFSCRVSSQMLVWVLALALHMSCVHSTLARRCQIRAYKIEAITEHCSENVTVSACWGYCQSSEVGIARPPFTQANHKVCLFQTYENITFTLSSCLPGYAPEKVIYPSALSCGCGVCDPTTTHCEG